jgi:hypothetical protein
MKPLIIGALLIALPPLLVGQDAEQRQIGADQVMRRMSARDIQRDALSEGYAGKRRYILENQRLHKRAEIVASVYCASDGSKHFDVVSQRGWTSANKRVLQQMLESESETSTPSIRPKTRLSEDNYNFSLLGTEVVDDRPAYVIGVAPKRRDKYLMEGRIWVDAGDYALVRAEGKPAQKPSLWTQSIHFVQQYKKNGPFWFPVSTDSVTEAVFFGTTYVSISYSDYVPNSTHSPSEQPLSREIAYAQH